MFIVEIDQKLAKKIGLRNNFQGRIGPATDNQVEGALKNGIRIEKINSERNDNVSNGSLGTVIGSVINPNTKEIGYFVVWDYLIIVNVFVIAYKIREFVK